MNYRLSFFPQHGPLTAHNLLASNTHLRRRTMRTLIQDIRYAVRQMQSYGDCIPEFKDGNLTAPAWVK